MQTGQLEHINVTVSDPKKTADMLCDLFDWHIRWSGKSGLGGDTIHVGNEFSYLAVYTRGQPPDDSAPTGGFKGGLNHIGVVVDDLDGTELRILKAGYKTHNHGDYEPGRRFYFHDGDGIEYEIVSYA